MELLKYKGYLLYLLPIVIFCCIYVYAFWYFLRNILCINISFNSINIFYLISIIFTLITLGQIILNVFSKVKEPSNFVKNLLEKRQKIPNFFYEVFHNLYSKILFFIPGFVYIITYIMPKWFLLSRYFLIIIYVFIYLPPFLVAMSFFIDVAIYNTFYYFPKSIYILLFPIFFRLCAWLFFEQCTIEIRHTEATISNI